MSNTKRIGRPPVPMHQRFWRYVSKSNGCWDWSGCLAPNGYGRLQVDGKCKDAHRVSWELHNGQVPHGLHVLHRCDNRKCVRPDHLFLGTHRENMEDMKRKGRAEGPKKLSAQEVAAIREMCRRFPPTLNRKAISFGVASFLGRWFAVSQPNISDIASQKIWRH